MDFENQWFMGKIRCVHFVGIGGIGMSGLAEILMDMGFSIQGSDISNSHRISELNSKGATIFIGHRPENISGADVVVYSSAISRNNVELIAAWQTGLPVIRRAEMLAEMMRLKYGIAIAGTHGKTTTTSITAHLLDYAGLNPTVVVGGNARNIGKNACIGDGQFFVAEADESDGSFLLLTPAIAVVTNIEEEHLDHYKDLTNILSTFARFLDKVPFFGCAIVCGDDPNILSIVRTFSRRLIRYGLQPSNDLIASNILYEKGHSIFTLRTNKNELGKIEFPFVGKHMILNALASIAIGLELNIPISQIKGALETYRGVRRRMDIRYQEDDLMIIDDYAHHPTEIKAVLDAIHNSWQGRMIVVFQPHRYTRTKFLINEFVNVLGSIEQLILLPIYAASESSIPEISHHTIAEQIKNRFTRQPKVLNSMEEVTSYLKNNQHKFDIVVTMGAGDINKLPDLIVEKLEKR